MSQTTQIEFTMQIWREGVQFIAHAMPLDVMSSGKTPEDAKKALDEAVSLFLRTAEEMGTLTDVLLESGYKWENGQWACPSWVAVEKRYMAIGAY
ncbi:MAG: hypothetical protein AB1656_26245 [Candidatus Omnitrophota bacterium]